MHKIFISYSHKNADWVKSWLVPKLESHGVPAHVDYRDFEIGVPSVINMERAVQQCAKTILVFTPDWVNSEWAQFGGSHVADRRSHWLEEKDVAAYAHRLHTSSTFEDVYLCRLQKQK